MQIPPLFSCILLATAALSSCVSAWMSSSSVSRSRRHHRGAAIKPLTCSSFLGYSSSSLLLRQSSHYQHFQKTSTLSMVFERMSEDCIGAIVTAQKESYKLGLEHVEPPVLLAGICDRPERTKPTLERYQITWRKTTQALSQLYPRCDGRFGFALEIFSTSQTRLALFETAPRMHGASRSNCQSNGQYHHSFSTRLFGVIEYEGETHDDSSHVVLVTVMQVLHKMVDPSLTSDDMYKTLLQDLQQADEKELLVAAGKESGTSSSSSTPTLEEVGTDLTLLAQQGRLDVVQGRDEEIKSCLRTLVRRRKNNPGTVP